MFGSSLKHYSCSCQTKIQVRLCTALLFLNCLMISKIHPPHHICRGKIANTCRVVVTVPCIIQLLYTQAICSNRILGACKIASEENKPVTSDFPDFIWAILFSLPVSRSHPLLQRIPLFLFVIPENSLVGFKSLYKALNLFCMCLFIFLLLEQYYSINKIFSTSVVHHYPDHTTLTAV